jgi:lambda repressor-like predicted transcriptional regulator
VPRKNNSKKSIKTSFEYRPELLIHTLMARLQARSLSSLSRKIDVSPSVLSKVMRRELPISSRILIKIHDSTGLPIRQLRTWMGDDRPCFSRIKI